MPWYNQKQGQTAWAKEVGLLRRKEEEIVQVLGKSEQHGGGVSHPCGM